MVSLGFSCFGVVFGISAMVFYEPMQFPQISVANNLFYVDTIEKFENNHF